MKKLKNTLKNIFMFVMRYIIYVFNSSQTDLLKNNGKPIGASPKLFVGNNNMSQGLPYFFIKMRHNQKNNTNNAGSIVNDGAALPNKAQSNSIYKQKYEQTKLLTELFMVYIEDYATNFIFSEEKAKELTALYYQAQTGVDIS